jgi:hypothetical protein
VPMLKREAQLASLEEHAGEAQRGDGRRTLIAGEAGVGKSALVEQVQRDLPGDTWCWATCDGLSTPRSLGPLFDWAPGSVTPGLPALIVARARRTWARDRVEVAPTGFAAAAGLG